MALVNETFFKAAGQLSVLGHSQKDQYFQDNAPQARRHPSGYRRRYPPTAASLHPSDAQGSGRDGRRQDISWIRPRTGYDFLIDAVIKHDYAPRGIHFSPQEYSSTTGRKAIRETSATSSAMTTVWGSPIPSIPYILTAT